MNGAPEATLERVPCIRYPTTFREKSVLALLDSGSEVNAFQRRSTAIFAKELGLRIRSNHVRFLEKTFLVANVSPEVVLGMPFDVEVQKVDGTTLDTYGK